MKGKKVAWLGDFGGFAPYEPGVLELCRSALKSFEAIGCVIDEAVPDMAPEPVWEAFKRLRWQPAFTILRPIEDGIVLADDFLRGVAADALGS